MKHAIAFLTSLMILPCSVIAAELLILNKGDATIATGDGPHEIELSTDGKLAFVSNYGANVAGNSLSVIDVPARSELQRVDLGELKRPHGLAFSGGHLYLTSEASKRVASLDPASRTIDWQFDTGQDGTHMVLAARDGTKLFASNMASSSISVIDRKSSQQTLVSVGAGPEGLDQSPDGRELWTAHSRDGGISIIDVTTLKVSHTFDAKTKRSNRLKFTNDGKYVLVSDLGAGDLVIIDVASRKEVNRIALGLAPTGILVAPAGDEAYVAVSGANHIAVVDLKTLKVRRRIETGKSPDGMAWSK
jgi:YVTN family beta-propeller protein